MKDKIINYWNNNICNKYTIVAIVLLLILIILIFILPAICWFLLVPMKQAVIKIANSDMLLGMLITGIIVPFFAYFLHKPKQ